MLKYRYLKFDYIVLEWSIIVDIIENNNIIGYMLFKIVFLVNCLDELMKEIIVCS